MEFFAFRNLLSALFRPRKPGEDPLAPRRRTSYCDSSFSRMRGALPFPSSLGLFCQPLRAAFLLTTPLTMRVRSSTPPFPPFSFLSESLFLLPYSYIATFPLTSTEAEHFIPFCSSHPSWWFVPCICAAAVFFLPLPTSNFRTAFGDFSSACSFYRGLFVLHFCCSSPRMCPLCWSFYLPFCPDPGGALTVFSPVFFCGSFPCPCFFSVDELRPLPLTRTTRSLFDFFPS